MYRIKQLLASDQTLYHTRDLGVLWGMENQQTLYTTISRYIGQGIFFPVQKGLYATVPLDRLDPYSLGRSLAHGYCYVTTETVLSVAGYINQPVQTITFAASLSRRVSVAGHTYLFRKLADHFLGNTTGIFEKNGVFWASPQRAVADMQYFSRHYHFDAQNRIDWPEVKKIQKEVGYL